MTSPSRIVRNSASSSDGFGPACARAKIAARRLAPELVEGDQRVVAAAQPRCALLDEAANERPVLVERGAFPEGVLVEGEREVGAASSSSRRRNANAPSTKLRSASWRCGARTAMPPGTRPASPLPPHRGKAPCPGPRWQPGHQ